MKRLLALAGEGDGETTALPSLAARILLQAERRDWLVPKFAIRIPRGLLVNEAVASPRRPPRRDGFERAIAVARAQRAHALVVLVDADDDCAATFGPAALEFFSSFPGRGVMAVREFETWLLLSRSQPELERLGIKQPERIRDAKKALRRVVPGYLPTTHQHHLARQIDIEALKTRSRSFDKFVRSILNVTSD